MNRIALIALLTLCKVSFVSAGGILTNTNQSAHFIRMVARDASTQIDAVYTNPAGLVKLKDGFHFSFTNQSAFQTRTITATSPIFMMHGGENVRAFEGTASAPIVPSLQGAYKVGKWVLSGSIAVTGGGGKATFDRGLPSFELAAGAGTSLLNMAGYKANQYQVDQNMKGSNFIFGGQLGGSYEINKMFSVYAGFRLNVVNNKYEGYLRGLKMNLTPVASEGYSNQMVYAAQIFQAMGATPNLGAAEKQLMGILERASSDEGAHLESSQSGWGVAPILGFNFNYENRLNVGVKYEFKTSLDVENNTKRDDTGMFADGVNTAHDIPSLLTVGVSYKVLPQMEVSVGYHHFFDSKAEMADGKQEDAGSTNEFLAGVEYQLNKMFLVSAGGQITKYGVGDIYQRDLSFSCDSYSIGFGGAANVSENVRLNVGYFWTKYSDYTKEPGGGLGTLVSNKDVFSRTNKVFAVGVDFSF